MTAATLSIGKLIRTAIAVLLMFVAITPALAEVGCLEDSFVHMEAEGDSHGAELVLENPAPNNSDDSQRSAPMHCAFNHGAHGFAVPVVSQVDVESHADREAYLSSIARPLISTVPDGPYHPPQA